MSLSLRATYSSLRYDSGSVSCCSVAFLAAAPRGFRLGGIANCMYKGQFNSYLRSQPYENQHVTSKAAPALQAVNFCRQSEQDRGMCSCLAAKSGCTSCVKGSKLYHGAGICRQGVGFGVSKVSLPARLSPNTSSAHCVL